MDENGAWSYLLKSSVILLKAQEHKKRETKEKRNNLIKECSESPVQPVLTCTSDVDENNLFPFSSLNIAPNKQNTTTVFYLGSFRTL